MMLCPTRCQLLFCEDLNRHLSSTSPSSSSLKTTSLYAVAIETAGMNLSVEFLQPVRFLIFFPPSE